MSAPIEVAIGVLNRVGGVNPTKRRRKRLSGLSFRNGS